MIDTLATHTLVLSRVAREQPAATSAKAAATRAERPERALAERRERRLCLT